MLIHVLFMQRKERYEGEFGPEALVAIDEFTNEENPEHFEKEVEKAKAEHASEAAGFALIAIEVDQDKIRRRCLGLEGPLKGTVRES